jgi:hypothetical protein
MIGRIGGYVRAHHVAFLALFLALGGGSAYAAITLVPRNSVGSAQVINSSLQTKDLSKKARAALKGSRGPRGFTGAQGAQGPQGATGAQGAQGIQGIQGPPGPFPDPLESGKTVRGVWTINDQASAAGSFYDDSLSFIFLLPSAPTVNRIALGAPTTAACPSSDPPQAAPGNFCLYESQRINLNFFDFLNPAANSGGNASREGVAPRYTSAAAGDVIGRGSWAVTAP